MKSPNRKFGKGSEGSTVRLNHGPVYHFIPEIWCPPPKNIGTFRARARKEKEELV